MGAKWELSSNNISSSASNTAKDVTDGHLSASAGPLVPKQWVQVVGAIFISFNAWALLLAFGTFEVYYKENLLSAYSSSEISWIATVAAFLLTIAGTLTGRLFDEGLIHPMLLIGSFLVILGMMMTRIARRYYEILLAEGLCVGLGFSLLWVPALSTVATCFQGAMRSVAIGIVSAGSSLGGVIYPILFAQLQPRIGFGWTVRAMALVALLTLAISLVTMLPTQQTSSSVRRLLDLSALREWPFVMMTLSGFFVLLGYYIPIAYLPTYALTAVKCGNISSLAFYTVVIANAASCPSRIIAGIIAGLVLSIPGSIVPLFCPTPAVIGTRMGIAWFGAALGILVGSPIGGALIITTETGQLHWWPLQVFSGLAMLIGGILCIPPWIHIHRRQRLVVA
nr:aspyridones efflux protein apdf [Quercus suber]